MTWFLYILKCSDGSFYIGITNNIQKRLSLHKTGKGSKYVFGRQPFILIYWEKHKGRSEASKREAVLKKLTRKQKQNLINKFIV